MPSHKSPPPYQPGHHRHHRSDHHHGSRHKHSDQHVSNPAYSYYPSEELLHFYRWTSPPGVMKIMCIIIIIMCVAVFACVASTLAWDYDMSMMGGGMAGMMPGMGGGMGGGSYGGGSYGGSMGGSYGGGSSYGSGGISGGGGGYGQSTQMDPKSGKGFIIGVAGVTFIAVLVIFILVVSRQSTSRSIKFYLASIVVSAILAFLMIIATIVYLVAVNPTAQSSGSIYYNQIRQLCAQYQNQNQASGIFINQYLYHYCVVEPQEAIAIVLGFLVFVSLIILLVFAVRTRSQMRRHGPDRVLWEEVKVIGGSGGMPNSIGEWVNNVSGEPEALVSDGNFNVRASREYLDQLDNSKPLYLPGDSEISSSLGGLKAKLRDYDAESVDELDDVDFSSDFPPIVDEKERLDYKRDFDRDHQEYKSLQAELDDINNHLADLDRELDRHPEGSPQFLDAMDEYTRLKNVKKSSDYHLKKKRSKYLKSKLSHIKRKVSEYDRRP